MWANDKINDTHDEEETEITFNFNNNATKNIDSEIRDELHTQVTSEAPRPEVEQSAPATENTLMRTHSQGPVEDIPLPKNIIERKTYTRCQKKKRKKKISVRNQKSNQNVIPSKTLIIRKRAPKGAGEI